MGLYLRNYDSRVRVVARGFWLGGGGRKEGLRANGRCKLLPKRPC